MDGGVWWATVHGVMKRRTRLSNFTFTFMHWRGKWQPTPMFLPGESQRWEHGGLPSMGSHRVWYDWRDLAAASQILHWYINVYEFLGSICILDYSYKTSTFSLSKNRLYLRHDSSVQLLSQVRLWDPMDCSTPGFPVHHQLLELVQTHVHWVGDAIQPSHPLLSSSSPAFNLPRSGIWPWIWPPHVLIKILMRNSATWGSKGQVESICLYLSLWRSNISYSGVQCPASAEWAYKPALNYSAVFGAAPGQCNSGIIAG